MKSDKMTTAGAVLRTDADKISTMQAEAKNSIIGTLVLCSSPFAEAQKGFRIQDWYNAYLLTPEFAEQDRKTKLEIMAHAESLISAVELLDREMHDARLGQYNESNYNIWEPKRK